jgi:hypothetical protein
MTNLTCEDCGVGISGTKVYYLADDYRASTPYCEDCVQIAQGWRDEVNQVVCVADDLTRQFGNSDDDYWFDFHCDECYPAVQLEITFNSEELVATKVVGVIEVQELGLQGIIENYLCDREIWEVANV